MSKRPVQPPHQNIKQVHVWISAGDMELIEPRKNEEPILRVAMRDGPQINIYTYNNAEPSAQRMAQIGYQVARWEAEGRV